MNDLLTKRLQSAFELAAGNAEVKGYKIGSIKVEGRVIRGSKVGYAGGASRNSGVVSGYIHIDSRFVEWCEDGHLEELVNVMRHELAHLIAETFNKKKKTGVWHGQAWKDIFTSLGGDGTRYYTGAFVKPENKGKTFKTKAELYQITPTEPATNWERGTYRQWLERGYHVIKGQKGQLQVWEFNANEYETDEDGKTSTWGRASAVYFTPDQVEPNKPLVKA